MALRPEDIYCLTEDDKKELLRREEAIDRELKIQGRSQKSIVLPKALFGEDRMIVESLLKKYRSVGWAITFQEENQVSFYLFERHREDDWKWRWDWMEEDR